MIRIGQLPNEQPGMLFCESGLSFSKLGSNNGSRIQYVKNSSFTYGFGCGVSIDASKSALPESQRTRGLIVENNVFLNANTPLSISGLSNIIRGNLVVETKSYGCYGCYNPQVKNQCTPGQCSIVFGNASIIEDNFIVGLTFIFAGDSCPYGLQFPSDIKSSVRNNIVHGAPIGVAIDPMHPKNLYLNCLRISGFTIYKSYMFAILYKTLPAVLIDNNILVDNHVGVYANIARPSSRLHIVGNKTAVIENNVIVGQSQTYACQDDVNIYINPPDPKYFGAGPKFDSKIGIVWSTFVEEFDTLWDLGW